MLSLRLHYLGSWVANASHSPKRQGLYMILLCCTCAVWRAFYVLPLSYFAWSGAHVFATLTIVLVSFCPPSSVLGHYILAPSLFTHLRVVRRKGISREQPNSNLPRYCSNIVS